MWFDSTVRSLDGLFPSPCHTMTNQLAAAERIEEIEGIIEELKSEIQMRLAEGLDCAEQEEDLHCYEQDLMALLQI